MDVVATDDDALEPTLEEKRAIASLKRLAKRWPSSLWLYAASGSLMVMRCGEEGEAHKGEAHEVRVMR